MTPVTTPRTRLVIINGLPATGKSTLAAALGGRLGLPVMERDGIKDFLFDRLGSRDRDWSRLLGRASKDMAYTVVDTLLAAGQPLIIEDAFHAGIARPKFAALVERYGPEVIEVYCRLGRDERRRRFRRRHLSGQRHPGHNDHENDLPETVPEPYDTYAPLGLGRLIYVDTAGPVDLDGLTAAIDGGDESHAHGA